MIKKSILPLAISDVDETYSCVAGVSKELEWLRPEPIFKNDLIDNNKIDFEHFTIFELESNQPADRIEDRRIGNKRFIKQDEEITNVEKEIIFQKINEPSVDNVFNNGKTAGLFKVKVIDIKYGRTFGSGYKIRIIFKDLKEDEFNFMVVDKKFKEWFLNRFVNAEHSINQAEKEILLEELCNGNTYFAITLSSNKTNFPGSYSGCHALISGIHVLDKNIYKKC